MRKDSALNVISVPLNAHTVSAYVGVSDCSMRSWHHLPPVHVRESEQSVGVVQGDHGLSEQETADEIADEKNTDKTRTKNLAGRQACAHVRCRAICTYRDVCRFRRVV